jgi:hypothetical protein
VCHEMIRVGRKEVSWVRGAPYLFIYGADSRLCAPQRGLRAMSSLSAADTAAAPAVQASNTGAPVVSTGVFQPATVNRDALNLVPALWRGATLWDFTR